MNQMQRKFLIDKIQSKADNQIRDLKLALPESPSASNHIIHAIMSNTIQLKTNNELKQVLLKRALKSKNGEMVLGGRWDSNDEVRFDLDEIFIFPKIYQQQVETYKEAYSKVSIEIKKIERTIETLIMRIQLASDKILQTMVNEVDDMGNLSLFDTTIKALTK